MGKLSVFNFVSLNGFFKGPNCDVSWAHGDEETDQYAIDMNNLGGTLLFGRVTYEMMVRNLLLHEYSKAERFCFAMSLYRCKLRVRCDPNNTRGVSQSD
jgi:dihydrofolate reductase